MTDQGASVRVRPLTVAATAVLVLAGVVVGAQAIGVARTMLTPSVDASRQLADQKQRIDAFSGRLDGQLDQLMGRSMYFLPPKPPPERKPPPPAPPAPPKKDPGPPPPPSRYGGPKIIAMMGDTVWFEGARVSVGEEHDGAKVISTAPPWSAKIEWKEVEFDVELFARTTPDFLVPREPDPDATPASPGDLPDDPAPSDPDETSTGDADAEAEDNSAQ